MFSKKSIPEATLLVENTEGDFTYKKCKGDVDCDTPVPAASITKLFTSACILILLERKELSLNKCVVEFFGADKLSGIHVFKGVNYSASITIADLLFQTSGLPDWFEEGDTGKQGIEKDFDFTFEDELIATTRLQPHFPPHTKKKAFYSDVNFSLLGEILERTMRMPLHEVYQELIMRPHGLMNTYLPSVQNSFVPNIYYGHKLLHRPKFITSCRASGGIVSTTNDLMVFLKKFFGGQLFSQNMFRSLSHYRALQHKMGPIWYGGGYMQIPLDGVATLFTGKGELLGHSGTTGSFAFYYPQKEMFFTGNLNQMAHPSYAIRLVMRLAMAA